MKKITILLIFSIFVLLNSNLVFAQSNPNNFKGAQADQKHYKVLYVLNSGDEKHIAGTLRNIKNAMNDPRLKDKLEVELVAFSDGVAVYLKTGKFKEQLEELRNRGVLLAQCENTIRERKIEKSELFDFISYVPSGNGEIIIRQQQGWSIVHP